jgi:NitT/TauT family transport system ATP-binding protein
MKSGSGMLQVRNLRKYYNGADGLTRAVEDISFDVAQGEFVSIVGPSGAGKTTLLRALVGLTRPTAGAITYKGKMIDGPLRDFALVFQDYARSLYPWFTVEKNIALPLVNTISDAARRRQIASIALEKVGLRGFERKRPTQLSGGQQQRVAIARALAYAPEVFVMDEPFASVDAQTRADLEDLVLKLKHETGATIILVTHDVDEAVYLSDRVIVLSRSPSSVLEDIKIDLPRERDQIATKALPSFSAARARILRLIKYPQTMPSEAVSFNRRVA